MIFNLSPGEVIQIGDGITLTVLAVEGDLIRFGLETPEEESPGTEDIGLTTSRWSRRWRNSSPLRWHP
jgi:hypothetical protein